MKRFWTSDPHYYHTNVIKYCNRPFNNVHEMNETLIMNHNSLITKDDEVYMLGDISFGQPQKTLEVLRRLNGKKFLILGNHDKQFRKGKELFQPFFEFIGDYLEVWQQDPKAKGGKQLIVMCHYPMMTWNKAHHGSWMCHGHCHTNIDHLNVGTTRHDIGVDGNNMFPWSYHNLKKVMDKKKYDAVDHHGNMNDEESSDI